MKKQLAILLLLYCWICTSLSGQNYNYAPNSLNIPTIRKRGEVSMGLGYGHATNSLDVQLAYSPFKQVLILGNYFHARNKEVRQQTMNGTDYYFGEAAIGFYETYKKGVGSITAGWGNGNLFSNYEMNNSAELSIQRWFVQPGFAYQSEFFHAAVALRFSRLNYTKANVSFSINPSDLAHIQNIEAKNPILLPELGIQAGIVFKPVYLGLSISSIFPDTNLWDFTRLNAALMLSTTFGTSRNG